MPATRSATRARAAASAARSLPAVDAKRPPKVEPQDPVVTKHAKKATKVGVAADVKAEVPQLLIPPSGEELAPLPTELKFSLEDAKNHLIQADYRFGDIFSRLPCKPFETVEGIHPFRSVIRHLPILQSLTTKIRTLCSSIL
jgi:DNA-3-methyladenine glycosylase II